MVDPIGWFLHLTQKLAETFLTKHVQKLTEIFLWKHVQVRLTRWTIPWPIYVCEEQRRKTLMGCNGWGSKIQWLVVPYNGWRAPPSGQKRFGQKGIPYPYRRSGDVVMGGINAYNNLLYGKTNQQHSYRVCDRVGPLWARPGG